LWRRIAELKGNVCTAISPAGISRSPRCSCASVGAPHGHRPRADAAHHHALEHGLTADWRIAPARSHARALLRRGGRWRLRANAPLEALDAATGVDQLLAPGVEGVAVGADLDAQLRLGGAGLESLPHVQRTIAVMYSGWISSSSHHEV